jgi:hypothetical protein
VASLLFHLEGYKLGKASVNCLCLSLDASSDGFVLSNFVHEDTSLVSAVDKVLERPFVTVLVIEIESQSTRLRESKLITVLVVNVGQGPLLLPWTNQRHILVWPIAL